MICERFYSKLALDFDANKRVTDEVAIVPSKRMRNKIAGFVTVRITPRCLSRVSKQASRAVLTFCFHLYPPRST
jgi:ribosomal protein S17E